MDDRFAGYYYCRRCKVKLATTHCPLCHKQTKTLYSSLIVPLRDFRYEWRPSKEPVDYTSRLREMGVALPSYRR